MKYAIALTYLAVISLISVIFTVHDKSAAKKKRRRIPERTLVLLSVLGGSAAMFLTMLMIRHKTLHAKFMLGIPTIMLLQLAALIAIYRAVY